MWFFKKKTTEPLISQSSSPVMKSEEFEQLMKRLTLVSSDSSALAQRVENLDLNFKKLQGLLYAKLYEPKTKEPQEKPPEEQKVAEPEELNPLKPPFW